MEVGLEEQQVGAAEEEPRGRERAQLAAASAARRAASAAATSVPASSVAAATVSGLPWACSARTMLSRTAKQRPRPPSAKSEPAGAQMLGAAALEREQRRRRRRSPPRRATSPARTGSCRKMKAIAEREPAAPSPADRRGARGADLDDRAREEQLGDARREQARERRSARRRRGRGGRRGGDERDARARRAASRASHRGVSPARGRPSRIATVIAPKLTAEPSASATRGHRPRRPRRGGDRRRRAAWKSSATPAGLWTSSG